MKTESKPGKIDYSYFGIQAQWGVTKHFGGLRQTDRLAELTRISAGTHVLEIGSGVGMAACHLVQVYGCRVTGIDLNAAMVAWAQKRARRKAVSQAAHFLNANALALPFPDHSFDVALCESVTAFVPDKLAALREYARVVRPGGYVALNEGTWLLPPPAELVAFVQRTMGGVDFQPTENWQALLRDAGLELVAAQVESIQSAQQRRDEVAGLDFQDWTGRMRAMGGMLKMLLTDAEFRRYFSSLTPSRRQMRSLFEFMGYGLYVGRVMG